MNDVADARQLLQGGQLVAAERAYEKLLEAAPRNVEALNVVALGALRAGHVARARELLERAVLAAPRDAISRHHLGQVHAAVGDFARAVAENVEAVRLEPGFYLARLSLASGLERMGDREQAIIQYKRSLGDAQRHGQWLNPSTTPESLQALVSHAVRAVRQGRRAVFDGFLERWRGRFGGTSMTRVERCLRIYLNEEPPVYVDSRQRPSFLLFPDLPAVPYFDLGLFDWLEGLQQATDVIRGELAARMDAATGSERVFPSDALEAENLRGLKGPPSWTGYYFYRHGVRREENCLQCPATARALDALSLCSIREHGPEVLFSVFTAGTHLKPHRGVTNTRVVGHLPLIVPPDCALNVGGEIHEWHEGRVVVFDDTYEHEAWNRSDRTRVVLIFDVWNPYLSEAERVALTDMVGDIGDFRRAAEQA